MFFYKIYKDSVVGTIMSIFGGIALAIGVMLTIGAILSNLNVTGLIIGVPLVAVGVALSYFAEKKAIKDTQKKQANIIAAQMEAQGIEPNTAEAMPNTTNSVPNRPDPQRKRNATALIVVGAFFAALIIGIVLMADNGTLIKKRSVIAYSTVAKDGDSNAYVYRTTGFENLGNVAVSDDDKTYVYWLAVNDGVEYQLVSFIADNTQLNNVVTNDILYFERATDVDSGLKDFEKEMLEEEGITDLELKHYNYIGKTEAEVEEYEKNRVMTNAIIFGILALIGLGSLITGIVQLNKYNTDSAVAVVLENSMPVNEDLQYTNPNNEDTENHD